MSEELRELWRYRELLFILVKRDLKARYKNSVLGFGWSLLNPLMQVITITFVIKFMMQAKQPNFHAYVFCAMLPWLFFSTAIMDASPSLLYYFNLLRRTYFPRELIPLAAVLSNLVHFALATVVYLVYMAVLPLAWWGITGKLDWPLQATLVFIPIPMLGLVLLVMGIGMFTSVWTLYFEDMRFIADSGLKILYWLVPLMYYPDMIREHFQGKTGEVIYTLYMLNPLATYLTVFKKLTLAPAMMPGARSMTTPMGAEDWLFLAIAFIVSAVVALLGHRYFCAQQWKLAERA
jgi:ABC-type polysaccharide/polyol phosphate export permease